MASNAIRMVKWTVGYGSAAQAAVAQRQLFGVRNYFFATVVAAVTDVVTLVGFAGR